MSITHSFGIGGISSVGHCIGADAILSTANRMESDVFRMESDALCNCGTSCCTVAVGVQADKKASEIMASQKQAQIIRVWRSMVSGSSSIIFGVRKIYIENLYVSSCSDDRDHSHIA